MAAGPRSLLAFWVGGAGAPRAGAGVRSLLAPWIGGASAATETQAGARSLLAPWIGGASATTPAEQAAVRSLLAFWLGGASASPSVEPPTPPAIDFSGGLRLPIPRDLADRLRRQLIEEDEVIAMVLLAALPGLLRRH